MMHTIEDMNQLEQGGYLCCLTCQAWHDDGFCYPDDHSKHCGHELKPIGSHMDPDESLMVLKCQGQAPKLWTPGKG